MTLTEELAARAAREVPDTGHPAYDGMTKLADGEYPVEARRLLAENLGAPLWVFGFGSLIWKPAFEFVESRRVVAYGWRRMYSLDLDYWRATPDEPGLMLALEPGGSCVGMAYRMPDDNLEGRMIAFLRREAAYREDLATIRWITVRAAGERFRALVSWAAPRGDPSFVYLPIAEQAKRLARAVGHLGSCAEYLHNTVTHLEEMGIRDSYMWQMQHLVAEEIKALHPRAGD